MIETSFYNENELKRLGFKSFGKNVFISRHARLYGTENMSFGDNVRIDDFCILSGNIFIGSFIHISAYVGLYGKAGIEINDYSGISPGCRLFSASDDFSGDFFIGPMVEQEYIHLICGKIILKRYVQIGANSIVLPGVTLEEGSVTGAMSLINKNTNSWKMYAGIPATCIKERNKGLLDLKHEKK